MDPNESTELDDFDRVAATGEWWINPWWEHAEPNFLFPVPLEKVRHGAEVLREYFDAEWYKRLAAEPRKNLVFPYLCLERASWALSFIATFGARLERLQNAEGLSRPLCGLRERDGKSAFLELEVAEGFAETGYHVSFPKEGGPKSFDVLAVKDELRIAVECKRLMDEEWESWEEELMREIGFTCPHQHDGRDISVDIALNPRLSQLRMGMEEYAPLNKALSAGIKQAVLAELEAALASFSPPHELFIPEVARIGVDWKKSESFGSVSGMERSAPATFRRIFQNALLPALKQLPRAQPGAVVIYSKYAPPAPFFRLLFDAACKADGSDSFSDLVAVLICTLQTVFQSTPPTVFCNRFAAHSVAADAVKEVFSKTFRAVEG